MDALRITNLILLGRVKFSKNVLGIEPKGSVVHTTFEQSKLYKSCLFGPIVLSNLCKIFKSSRSLYKIIVAVCDAAWKFSKILRTQILV